MEAQNAPGQVGEQRVSRWQVWESSSAAPRPVPRLFVRWVQVPDTPCQHQPPAKTASDHCFSVVPVATANI